MVFSNPSFLWALLALAIPVIIHLFHFRRYKTVYFSNVRFLNEVRQERNNIRQLKRWLLLASRLAALALIALAFAGPVLRGNENAVTGPRAVSVYLDNSASMAAKYKGVDLLEWGRDRAREIVQSYGPEDVFQVLTNDMSLAEQRWMSREDALTYLGEVQLSQAVYPMSGVLDKQTYLFGRSGANSLRRYLISDFQTSMMDDAEIPADSTALTWLVSLQSGETGNVYVDSVWLESPVGLAGTVNPLLFRVRNSGNLDASSLRVSLEAGGSVQSVRELNLAGNETRIDTLYLNTYEAGWQRGTVSVDDYPVTTDDAFYFSFDVAGRRRVLEVAGPGASNAITRIFSDDPAMAIDRSDPGRLNYTSFADYDLLVLNELRDLPTGLVTSLQAYVDGGGNVLLIPAEAPDLASYNDLLGKLAGASMAAARTGDYSMARPDLANDLLRNIVDRFPGNAALPSTGRYFPVAAPSRTRSLNVLSLNNGEALLTWFPGTAGHFFVQSVPASGEFSSLHESWIYAPVVYNMALYKSLQRPLSLTLGEDQWVAVGRMPERRDDVARLEGEGGGAIPAQRVADNRLLLNAGRGEGLGQGHYEVIIGEQSLGWLSFNADRRESELKFATNVELKSRFPMATVLNGTAPLDVAQARYSSEGRPLWRLFLALGILFLLMEVAIIKWLPE